MKNMKKIGIILLTLSLICTCMLAGCSDSQNSGPCDYSVTVKDANGNLYGENVIVRFLQNGNQVAMQTLDDKGTATKELERGEYTVELKFTDGGAYYYDQSSAKLSKDKTSLEIVLSNLPESSDTVLSVGGEDYSTSIVNTGCTYVELTAGKRSYFLFTPTVAGLYSISAVGEGLSVGYYGNPFYVQSANIGTQKNGVTTVSVKESMIGDGSSGTMVMVIGVDSQTASGGVLSIVRTGDPILGVEDMPWTEYKTTAVLSPYTLPAGKTLTFVDIKGSADACEFVYSEADGYYHLGTETGPVILVCLGPDSPNVSLQKVIQGDGSFGGAPIRRYFYDENNNFVKKEDYTDILIQYFSNMDKDYGVYPLTSDLIYIIQNGCCEWWDASSNSYILEGCNPEIGWKFACCYAS